MAAHEPHAVDATSRRDVEVADSLWGKFMGLMGRRSLPAGAGLWLPGTNGIHMMFMRFPIDAVFVGRPDGDRRATRPVASIARFGRGRDSSRSSAARTASWSFRSARSTPRGPRWATSSRCPRRG